VERVLNACAFRLAGQLINWWSNPTPAPTAMRDLIKTEILPGLRLAESSNEHQLLDGISLGENMKPYAKEVADWANALRKRRNDLNIPYENLQRFISVEQEKYAPHFNDSDSDPRRWSDYFQKMWDNLNQLKEQKRRELRETIVKMTEDRFRGPKFVRQFLEVLQELLTEFRSQFDQDRQKIWLAQERSAANALQVLLKQIDDHAKQFMLLNRKNVIEEDFKGIMAALEAQYVSKVEVKARSLGVLLIDALKSEIDQLLIDLTAFEKNLSGLQSGYVEREQVYVRETGTLTVNGILLYDTKDIDQIYTKTLGDRLDVICQGMSQDVLANINTPLFNFFTFDSLRIKDISAQILNRALDEFVGSPHLQVSTARKFLEQYPVVEQQEAQLKTTFEKSEPFLRFSQEQARLGWDDRAEKKQTLIGVQGGNKSIDPAVVTILPMIRKTSTLSDKDIRPVVDPHHVYFIQEKGAFPLRLIEGMERMRAVYRSIEQADPNPLHTHTDDRQFGDIMPSTQAETSTRYNLVLAKILGLIAQVENTITGYNEVRFTYRDKNTGFEKTQVLGQDWVEAEAYLLADPNRRVRELLADAIQAVGQKAVTKPQKQALYQQLMTYISQLETSLPGGRDNSEFSKFQIAVEDYVKTYSLFMGDMGNIGAAAVSTPPAPNTVAAPITPTLATSVPTAPASTVPIPAAAPMATAPAMGAATPQNGNLEKFAKLADTCYRKGQPTATELELLERFRQKYNISQAQVDEIIAKYQPATNLETAVYEYGLMYRAFFEGDKSITFEEQAQLIELQEELELSNEQVATIETNIREELGM
jgi:hypothetical protein